MGYIKQISTENEHIPPTQKLVSRYESQTQLRFTPARGWYKSIGINQFRFGQLTRGRKEPDATEIKSLVTYFSQFFPCDAKDLLN